MFGKDVPHEDLCKFSGIDRPLDKHEHGLLGKSAHYHKDICVTLELKELLYEIHGYGFPEL